MFLYRSAAEHESELRNFVEQFKKHSKNKVNDLVNANMSSKVGQQKTKSTQKRKGKSPNHSSNTTPAMYISSVPPNPNSSILETSFPNVSLMHQR